MSLPRWLAMSTCGLGLLILTALMRGTPEDVGWYMAHVVPGLAVVAFCTSRIGRIVGALALVVYALILPVLTLLAGFGVTTLWDDGVRIKLFTDNPNLLGADLVAVTLAAMVVRPKAPWAVWLPVVGLAVAFTGSRTAIVALGLAFALWLAIAPLSRRTRIAAVYGLACLGAVVMLAQWQLEREAGLANMLPMSRTFEYVTWLTVSDARVSVTPGVVDGPLAGTRGDRVEIAAGEHRLALYQIVERSVESQPYVASVYLRSDAPQSLILSSLFSWTICDVDEAWQRCVTPSGVGDGSSWAQFRLETLKPGERIDVYAFGPQYEAAEAPSTYAERGATLLPGVLTRRIASWSFRLDDARVAAMQSAILAWRTAPLIGVGLDWANTEDADPRPDSTIRHIKHAHNLLLERLVSDGIFGLGGWFLIAMPLLIVGILHAPRLVPAWLTALVVLNSLDMSYFHSGTYFSAAIVAGHFWFASSSSPSRATSACRSPSRIPTLP